MIEAITSAMRAVIQSVAIQKAVHPSAKALCQGLTVN